MRAIPVVGVLPEVELLGQVRGVQVGGRVELQEVGLVRALDLAIQVRRGWPNRSELNRRLLQPSLDTQGKEFASTVGLETLNGKRHFLHDAFEKRDGVSGVAAREQTEHSVPRA